MNKIIKCKKCGGTGLASLGENVRGITRCVECHGKGEYEIHIPGYNPVEDVNDGINNVLGSSELLEKLNKLVIADTNERYIRELLNRIHKAIYLIKDLACYEEDTHQYCDDINWYDVQKIVEVLMGVDECKH